MGLLLLRSWKKQLRNVITLQSYLIIMFVEPQ